MRACARACVRASVLRAGELAAHLRAHVEHIRVGQQEAEPPRWLYLQGGREADPSHRQPQRALSALVVGRHK